MFARARHTVFVWSLSYETLSCVPLTGMLLPAESHEQVAEFIALINITWKA